ncbi:nibrin isoform X2 [Lasioglossum baleicum]|uniref:nibrin isoform X2 n=1 Tax=Lasioglossum baleicum TaxID=434251 RepID=UPI003FCED97C
MWYLTTSAGNRLYFKPNKEVTFGRKKSDILLQNDESISRLHASIYVKPKEKTGEPISTCELKDANSKYGTYIILSEEEKVEVTNTGTILKDGDKIRFGLQQHVFKVVYVPLITIVSSLQNTEKEKLQGILDEIDGMMINDWTSACTHLTVSKASLTEKVTWAMASAVPIVSLNFWEAVKHAIDNGDKLPQPEKFIPPISELLINKSCVSLCVNEKRKTLFRNFIFVHFNVRQYKMYGRMISMAGGKPMLYSRRPLTTKEVCAPNVIVLQYSDSDTTQSTQGTVPEYETIYNALRGSKRKMISETDIPLAILHCSTEKYCNPTYRFEELLKRPQSKPDSSEVLVLDSQDQTDNAKVLPKIISNVPVQTNFKVNNSSQNVLIPESCSSAVSDSVASQSEDIMIISISKTSQNRKNTVNTMKYIPETKDSYATQDLLITSTPKTSQDRKTTVNSEISIESRSARKIEEVQETTKYIPETKDSYDTQDLLKTGTLKASQDRKNTVNTEVSVGGGPAPKIKEVQKAEKYIPETKDSYATQDLLITSTPKTSQDRKTTVNSEISIESRSARKIEEVQETTKYIPETKDSYDTQDLLKTGTLKASQDRKNTINTEVLVGGGPAPKIKEVQKAEKYIPETKDSFDTQDLLITSTPKTCQDRKTTVNSEISIERRGPVQRIKETNDSTQTQDILRAGTSKVSQNARDAVNNDIPIERIATQRIQEVCSRKTVKHISESSESSQSEKTLRVNTLSTSQIIKSTSVSDVLIDKKSTQKVKEVNSQRTLKRALETNDSSDDTEKGAQHSLQRSQWVKNTLFCSTLQGISPKKPFSESRIANKGTPANDVIDLLDDEDDDEEEENKLEEILMNRERSNIHPNSILSPEKLSKLFHDRSIKSPEVNRHCTPLSRADNIHSAKTVSQIEDEPVTKSKKRNKSFDEFDERGEDVLTLTASKKSCSDNSVTAVPVTSSNTVKPSQAENHNNLLRNNTSSFRASINFKKFKKVLCERLNSLSTRPILPSFNHFFNRFIIKYPSKG